MIASTSAASRLAGERRAPPPAGPASRRRQRRAERAQAIGRLEVRQARIAATRSAARAVAQLAGDAVFRSRASRSHLRRSRPGRRLRCRRAMRRRPRAAAYSRIQRTARPAGRGSGTCAAPAPEPERIPRPEARGGVRRDPHGQIGDDGIQRPAAGIAGGDSRHLLQRRVPAPDDEVEVGGEDADPTISFGFPRAHSCAAVGSVATGPAVLRDATTDRRGGPRHVPAADRWTRGLAHTLCVALAHRTNALQLGQQAAGAG